MTYKGLAFFDLDGTLLNEHSQITEEIKSAVTQLKMNHILPIIATGRTEKEILQIKEASGITSSIVMNGAVIRIDNEVVYEEVIHPDICQRMMDATNKKNHAVSFYNSKDIWASRITQDMIHAYGFIHSEVPSINLKKIQTEPINMLLVLGQDGDSYYHEEFPELTFYRNGPYSIDTVLKGTSKGRAVRKVQELLAMLDVPTYGFGDGPNDIALLEACDFRIAMGNGRPEVKSLATFITKENTNGGIVHALKHYQLI